MEKTKQFLQEVKQELKKVVWPPRKHAVVSTSVVLIFVFFIAFFLGLIDLGLAWAIKYLMS